MRKLMTGFIILLCILVYGNSFANQFEDMREDGRIKNFLIYTNGNAAVLSMSEEEFNKLSEEDLTNINNILVDTYGVKSVRIVKDQTRIILYRGQ